MDTPEDVQLILKGGVTYEEAVRLFTAAMETDAVQKAIEGKTIKRVIVVKGKLINIVAE